MSTATNDVRRLIYGGSTLSGSLSTADLQWFVDNKPNTYLAAAAAAEAEGARAGAGRKKVGDLEIDEGDGGWMTLAKALRLQGVRRVAPFSGGISRAQKESARSDTDWDEPFFSRGQFDYGSSTGGSTY